MNYVYLDNAATSHPKSDGVFQAIKTAYYTCGNGSRSGHPLSLAAADTVYACREALAALFGTKPENVVLCSGATMALNMAIKGLAPESGGVLCSSFEHNSVLRPMYSLAAEGLKLGFFTPSVNSASETVDKATAAMKGNVRLMAVTHASNVCGVCLPVKELCAEARRRGIVTVVDCAQSAGHIPLSIKELGADVICIAGHKGLGGPMGVGALITAEDSALKFKTLIEGGTGVASRDSAMPPFLPERLEAGTANIIGIAGLLAACRELETAHEKEEALRRRAVEGLKALNGVKVYGGEYDGEYAPVTAFNIKKLPSDRAAELLAERGIYLRGGLHCAPLTHSSLGTGGRGAVRASFGRYNTQADADALVEAVSSLVS